MSKHTRLRRIELRELIAKTEKQIVIAKLQYYDASDMEKIKLAAKIEGLKSIKTIYSNELNENVEYNEQIV